MEGYFYPTPPTPLHAHTLQQTLSLVCVCVYNHGWRPGAPRGGVRLASWHAALAALKFLIAFRGLWCSLHIPHLCPTILLTSPHAGNCILTTAKADKWGRRGAAHCHQQTWPVSHRNLQYASQGPTIHARAHISPHVYTEEHVIAKISYFLGGKKLSKDKSDNPHG